MKKAIECALVLLACGLPVFAGSQPVTSAQLQSLIRNVKPLLQYPFSAEPQGHSSASVATYINSGSPVAAGKKIGLQLAKAIIAGTQGKVSSVSVRFYDVGSKAHWFDLSISSSVVERFNKTGQDQKRLLAEVNVIEHKGLSGEQAQAEGASTGAAGSLSNTSGSVIPWAHELEAWQQASQAEQRARIDLEKARTALRNYVPTVTAYNEPNPNPEKLLQSKIDSNLKVWQDARQQLDTAYSALEQAKRTSQSVDYQLSRASGVWSKTSQGGSAGAGLNDKSSEGNQPASSLANKQKAWEEACKAEVSARSAVDEAKGALRNFSPVPASDESFNSNRERQLQKDVETASRTWQQARDDMDRAYNALNEAKQSAH